MQTTSIKADLLESLRANGADIGVRLRAIPDETFTVGGLENGWNGHQILAHVASVEWTYPRLVDLARLGSIAAASEAVDAFDVNAYNQRQIDKRADTSVTDLIAEFERNRAATIASVEDCDDQLLATHVKSVGGVEGTLAEVLTYVAVHHATHHLDDIVG